MLVFALSESVVWVWVYLCLGRVWVSHVSVSVWDRGGGGGGGGRWGEAETSRAVELFHGNQLSLRHWLALSCFMEINWVMEINYFSKMEINYLSEKWYESSYILSISVHLISALLNQIIFNLSIYVHLYSVDRTNSISLPFILLSTPGMKGWRCREMKQGKDRWRWHCSKPT